MRGGVLPSGARRRICHRSLSRPRARRPPPLAHARASFAPDCTAWVSSAAGREERTHKTSLPCERVEGERR